MIYGNYKKWIYYDIENPFKTMNKLKGVFKPLKCYFKFSRKDWYPVLWVSNPSKIQIMFRDVMWKDKYDTPRYENCPYIWIHLFGLNFIWYWLLPNTLEYTKEDTIDDYWEQALWYLYYHNNISYGMCENPNINNAEESWPWENADTGKSSWNNKFLIK